MGDLFLRGKPALYRVVRRQPGLYGGDNLGYMGATTWAIWGRQPGLYGGPFFKRKTWSGRKRTTWAIIMGDLFLRGQSEL